MKEKLWSKGSFVQPISKEEAEKKKQIINAMMRT
jgi:hypothetical protein